MSLGKQRRLFRDRFLVGIAVGLVASLIALGLSSTSFPTSGDRASAQTTTITVSAAASLQDALEAISPEFQASHADIAVSYNFASSGALQRQLEQGAPADVFFSASPLQMDA